MPGTIKDGKSAIAHSSNVASPKYRAQFKNLESKSADFGLRKLVIGGLAALLSICPAGIAEARYVNLDCAEPTYVTCRDASRFLDLNAFINSMYSGSPKQFITSRHGGCGWHDSCGWYSNRNTGDYLDRWWYDYLDEGQYYYLDRTQYKLLGGLSYILGHPCYPKLYERRSEQAVGFTNMRRIGLPRFDCCWDYLTTCKPASLSNVCTGYILQKPTDKYVIWHSCFKPGDHIEKLRYRYLDKGRYRMLDETQYKWLGGLAYLFESPSLGNWYTYSSPYSSDFPYRYDSLDCLDFHRLFETLTTEDITEEIHTIPEPASAMILGLGSFILALRRRRK